MEKNAAILAVSFGTSYHETRNATIGAIEEALAKAFPQYEVRRAFTSQMIINKLKKRDGIHIDNVQEALERAIADGIKTLIVQPTHLMDGFEYNDVCEELETYRDSFDDLVLGAPLLDSEEDFQRIYQKVKMDRTVLEDRLKSLQEQAKQPVNTEEKATALVKQFLDSGLSSRELLVSLIERVELTEEKDIIIKFRFRELEAVS